MEIMGSALGSPLRSQPRPECISMYTVINIFIAPFFSSFRKRFSECWNFSGVWIFWQMGWRGTWAPPPPFQSSQSLHLDKLNIARKRQIALRLVATKLLNFFGFYEVFWGLFLWDRHKGHIYTPKWFQFSSNCGLEAFCIVLTLEKG